MKNKIVNTIDIEKNESVVPKGSLWIITSVTNDYALAINEATGVTLKLTPKAIIKFFEESEV